jgi:hypothetical protein
MAMSFLAEPSRLVDEARRCRCSAVAADTHPRGFARFASGVDTLAQTPLRIAGS